MDGSCILVQVDISRPKHLIHSYYISTHRRPLVVASSLSCLGRLFCFATYTTSSSLSILLFKSPQSIQTSRFFQKPWRPSLSSFSLSSEQDHPQRRNTFATIPPTLLSAALPPLWIWRLAGISVPNVRWSLFCWHYMTLLTGVNIVRVERQWKQLS